MSTLSSTIRDRATALVDTQVTYKQQVVTVNQWVNGVVRSSLPVFPGSTQPADWQQYLDARTSALEASYNWVNDVLARLLSVPGEVITYNSEVTQLLADAANQATALQANPGNTAARTALTQDLQGLQSQLSLVSTFVSGALTQVQNFKDQLPAMSANLTTVANLATADSKVDATKIAQLVADINRLQSEIDGLIAAMVALGIADAAALTLGGIASIVAFPVGLVSWLFMGPIVAVATYELVMDGEKITADKQQIEADQANMDDLTQAVAALNLLANQYAGMVTAAEGVEQGLAAVLTEWQAFEADVAGAINEINTAVADESATNFAAVAADLQQAGAEWTAVYTQAGALEIDLQVNDANLTVGMSAAEVSSALAAGKVWTNPIEYFNSFSDARVAVA